MTDGKGIDEEYLRGLLAGTAADERPAAAAGDKRRHEHDAGKKTMPKAAVPGSTSERYGSSEYAERFLKPHSCENRQGVYIDRELHKKISVIVGVAGNRNMTVGGYIDRVLEYHFEQFGDAIKSYCAKSYSKIF